VADSDPQNPGVRFLTVDRHSDGQRLDNYLVGHLKGVPKSWLYRVVRRGEVRVNKGRCKPDRRVRAGDVVRVPPMRVAERTQGVVPPALCERVEAAVVHEDAGLLIVDKPAGIAVHGGSGVSHGVIEILRAARPTAGFLELAHRLDRETSGCLMVARQRPVLRELQQLQREGRIRKRYLALLTGRTRKGAWRVDQPLRKNTLASGERIVRVDPTGKAAITDFRVIRHFDQYTLVEAELHTGRTHQIRVHARACGQPIAGDAKYGDPAAERCAREQGLRRLFLHAASLSWTGSTGTAFAVEAPLPAELQAFLARIGEGRSAV
jgi:23S rRNA pseudouridine955/2504/2580 synthase